MNRDTYTESIRLESCLTRSHNPPGVEERSGDLVYFVFCDIGVPIHDCFDMVKAENFEDQTSLHRLQEVLTWSYSCPPSKCSLGLPHSASYMVWVSFCLAESVGRKIDMFNPLEARTRLWMISSCRPIEAGACLCRPKERYPQEVESILWRI